MRYFGYCRVSSKDQKVERQIYELTNINRKIKLYKDIASGKNFDRPMYKKMLKNFKKGDILYVTSLDRLGRNYSEIHSEWAYITKKLKVKINVLDMPVLNRTSENDIIQEFIADLILQVLAFCADNERKNILERQKQGIECAKSRGVVFGRPSLNLPENFKDIVRQYKMRKILLNEALELCGCSKASFYRYCNKI